MQPEVHKLLVDIQLAMEDIRNFTSGIDCSDYRKDRKCSAAVERKFEVIGKARARVRDRFPDIFEKIGAGHQIIGFRNRLIHGYDNVDDAIVWNIVTSKLPILAMQVNKLME